MCRSRETRVPNCHLDTEAPERLAAGVILYGLADDYLNEVVEFFPSRARAEDTLHQVLADEPDFESILHIVEVDLASEPWRVSPVRP
jgi:hypothetical protein